MKTSWKMTKFPLARNVGEGKPEKRMTGSGWYWYYRSRPHEASRASKRSKASIRQQKFSWINKSKLFPAWACQQVLVP
jgi:hypothetical protein